MVDADMGEAWYVVNEPCRLCRKENVPISGDFKLCGVCYKEVIVNVILERTPHS